MSTKQEVLKNLPAVDKLLSLPTVEQLIAIHGKAACMYAIKNTLNYFRNSILDNKPPPSEKEIVEKMITLLSELKKKSLKKVFNATGIIIHTNLGRTPFGGDLLYEAYQTIEGYNNLEYNLENASRGSRNVHTADILKYLTGAEDVLIVNNAAAAVVLILRTFAKNKEVIVSRGELIEIGGSFRIPDIMAASDCIMREVGTTNKTNINDFAQAISTNTALLFKAHKSNYTIKGFTEEVSLGDLIKLGKKKKLAVFYDLGSGLLENIEHPIFKDEPNVKTCLEMGVDIMCFSGDKLLGGPQAGIIVGKKKYIEKLKKEPLLRALRVCKTTLALLETTCTYFLDKKTYKKKNLFYRTLLRSNEELKSTAVKLTELLNKRGMTTAVVKTKGRCGGGTLPEGEIDSYAVKLEYKAPNKQRSFFAEQIFKKLLTHNTPVLGILKKGDVYFDVLTIFDNDLDTIAEVISEVYNSENPNNK